MINLETLLNIKIDKIYCISLKDRSDRREFLKSQFEKLDHEIHFHIVQKNKDPIRGCLESHLDCIKEAKELGFNNILMLEDDILINEKILEDIKSINIPKNFDMFYLGYHVNDGLKYGKNILKLLSAQTTHAYIMNSQIFDYVINNIEKEWNSITEWSIRNKYESRTNFNVRAIDLFYSKWIHHQRQKSYGIYPILIHQKPDFSDIENRNIDYKSLMENKSKEFYKIVPYKYDTWVLNLDKRTDRWTKMEKLINENELNAFRIKAIDGMTFNFENYMDLFSLRDFRLRTKNPYQTHQYKKGVLGCALSHYKMWESMVQNKNLNNEDYILIIEDDCNFIDNIQIYINSLLDELKFKQWDICYLGYTDYSPLDDDKEEGENLIKLSGSKRMRGGGTFGYFLTKSGAKKLYNLANDRNIQQAVDWFMIEQYDKINAYKTKNDLIFSNVAGVKGHDSDVQNISKQFKNIKIEYFYFKNNHFLKDQYNNIYQLEEHPFKINYFGTLLNNNEIQVRRFHNSLVGTDFAFNRENEYIAIYVGTKMKFFVHFFAKYLKNILKKRIIVFHDNFDYTLDNILYIQKEKFDKLNKILDFPYVFVFDINIFICNYLKNNNKIILIEDGEFFNNTKFNNILLPDFGNFLLQNFLHKVHNIYGLSDTNIHYFKLRSKIIEPLPIIPPIFNNTLDIFPENDESKLNIKDTDILFLSYDFDIKSIRNFFNSLDIPNKKLLIFSDIFKSTQENILVKPRLLRGNTSYLNNSTFLITQSRKTDDYFILHLALEKGVICIIPEYYRELSNKTITFKNNLMEVKNKIESCITTPTKKTIYQKIGKTHIFNLKKQLESLSLFS